MTCIVGIETDDGVVIGGDSAGVSGYSFSVRMDEKCFVNGPFIFGFTSSFRMGQLLHWSLSPPRLPEDDDDLDRFMVTEFVDIVRKCLIDGGYATKESGAEEGGTFLVGVAGRLYLIDSDYQVGRNACGYDAVGCGADIALGALHATTNQKNAKKRILAALEAAEAHSAGVSGPFILVEDKNQ